MRKEEILKILSNIKIDTFFLKDVKWVWRVMDKGDGYLIQLEIKLPCVKTGELTTQRGEKRYLSSHSIQDEVVNSAFDLVKKFFEHEIRESFKFRVEDTDEYVPIYQPHWNVNELAKFYDEDKIAQRKITPMERHSIETRRSPFGELQDFKPV